ncbi:hypothetical protein DLAC_02814 [Tieghemostelium lacteum]|uniref:Leucine-rich repeat-containing protein (LRR) n=1 Tax=Tieghemostelium lacteum TaxID=361077 RepID=A0A152A3Y4_TIELA|nr:hypothetical protein DLAC_02814 [Tieghemostelium lacteum]|eukprot:KYR00771.1 hypothetical protein DLAC_02814 [Tieghemostelium lacteum]
MNNKLTNSNNSSGGGSGTILNKEKDPPQIFPNTIFSNIIQKISEEDPRLSVLIKLALVCRRWALQIVPYHFRVLKHSNFDEILKLTTQPLTPLGRECKFTDILLTRPSKPTSISLSSLQISHMKSQSSNQMNAIQLVNGKLLRLLTTCTTLRSLSISSISLDYEVNFGQVLGDILKNPSIQLQKLELMNLDLVSNGAAQIIQSLKSNSNLLELNLSRNFLKEKEGILLGDVIKDNKSLQKLDLSFNDFRVSGLRSIIESFQYNNTITSVNLEAVCRLDCMITGINLSSPPLTPSSSSLLNNNSPGVGILINNTPLQTGNFTLQNSTSFNNHNINTSTLGQGMFGIPSPHNNYSSTPPPFFQLSGNDNVYFNNGYVPSSPSSLSMNSRLIESMKGLYKNHSIKYLNLTHNTFGKFFNQCITDLIQENHSIQTLQLNYLKLDDESGAKLSSSLRSNRSLLSLSLIYNQLGRESGRELANSLSFNRYLTHVYLSNNSLTEDAGNEFAGMLKVNSTLLHLDLSDNTLGSNGVSKIFESLRSSNNTLRKLYLKNNKINDNAGQSLSIMIKENKYLNVLDISNNQLQVNSGMMIANSLESNKSLETLWISNNQMMELTNNTDQNNVKRCVQSFQNLFQKNFTLQTFDLDQGNHYPDQSIAQLKSNLSRNQLHSSIFHSLVDKKKKKKKCFIKFYIKINKFINFHF